MLNGASDLMVAAFGDKGRHSRSTVGVASLPADAPRSKSKAFSKYPERSRIPMRAPDWLTARPVAHRGLHDISRGIVENMPARGAVPPLGLEISASNVDIQLTSAMARRWCIMMTGSAASPKAAGALLGMTAAELKAVQIQGYARSG